MVSAARAMRAVPASSSPWPPAISWAPPDGILAILTPRTPGMPPSRAFPPSMPKSRAFFNSLFFFRRQFTKDICQRGARLKTGNTKQHTLIVRRDGHFREHRIFFQFSQLRFTHTAPFNPCKAIAVAEQT